MGTIRNEILIPQGISPAVLDIPALTDTELQEVAEKHPLIGNIAGVGLHIGIDLVKDRETKERAVEEADSIMYKAMERGLAFKTIEGNIITLRPALTISMEKMDQVIDILDKTIGEIEDNNFY